MEAYCVKCKQKRMMNEPNAAYSASGKPFTLGVCPTCGTRMSRLGLTEAHEHAQKPDAEPQKAPTKTAKKKKEVLPVAVKSKLKATPVKKKTPVAGNGKKSGKLVIVESPAKAKTIGRFLGQGYTVRASVGHVRDLLKSTLSVDVEQNFEPTYRVPNEKRAVVKEISALAKNATQIYLATDPDREGEAIAWHLLKAAEMDDSCVQRIVFHEITKPAIEDAFRHPQHVNMSLVDAQQARRILDRLVGYNLSPLLWSKIRGRLSAGRVQSVTVRLIVEREQAIEQFDPREYWTIVVDLYSQKAQGAFSTRLVKIDGADATLQHAQDAEMHAENLRAADFVIQSIRKSTRKRRPSPPFTTSALQQEASKRLGFTAAHTMALAQQLYEGIEIGEEGTVGLITYMRTDSTTVSEIAQAEARKYIGERFGAQFVPSVPPQYRTRAKGAQEAHEAIRPTGVLHTPDKMKEYLGRDLLRLYRLIWERFVASQMEDALYDTMTIEVVAKNACDYVCRSSGSAINFSGFLAVYEDMKDEDLQEDKLEHTIFPLGLAEKETLDLKRVLPEQHFTQPPARFTEATLVKALEENGIGRPSTYASIISTIQTRGYIYREAKRLFPTETGVLVNNLLVQSFPEIIDVHFTSRMESELDEVAGGEKQWQSVVSDFYAQFEPALDVAKKDLPKTQPELEKVGRSCSLCGKDLVIRHGRFGKFISCSGFPTCRYTEPILVKMGIKCPECADGELIIRKSRNGRTFYGCSTYPGCKFTTWNQPVNTVCPKCGGLMCVSGKNRVQCIRCAKEILRDAEESN